VPHVIDERHGTIHVPVLTSTSTASPTSPLTVRSTKRWSRSSTKAGASSAADPTPPRTRPGAQRIELVDLNGDGHSKRALHQRRLPPRIHPKPYHGVQCWRTRELEVRAHPLAPCRGDAGVAADFFGAGARTLPSSATCPPTILAARAGSAGLDPALAADGAGQVSSALLGDGTCDHLTCCVTELRAARRWSPAIFTINPAHKIAERSRSGASP